MEDSIKKYKDNKDDPSQEADDQLAKELEDLIRNLTALKTRMQGLEDKTKIVVVNVEDSGDQTRGANLANDINQLKEKLKNMENELREIKEIEDELG